MTGKGEERRREVRRGEMRRGSVGDRQMDMTTRDGKNLMH